METAGAPVPDPQALRRRVLGTAVLTLAAFLAISYVISALGVSSGWLLPCLVLLWLLVVRPLLAPVRAANTLRRRLAYQAFLDQREEDGHA